MSKKTEGTTENKKKWFSLSLKNDLIFAWETRMTNLKIKRMHEKHEKNAYKLK